MKMKYKEFPIAKFLFWGVVFKLMKKRSFKQTFELVELCHVWKKKGFEVNTIYDIVLFKKSILK